MNAEFVSRQKEGAKATKGKIFATVSIIAFMVMMLSKPDFYLDSARRGLTLFATAVLPSLFPFYFCALLLTNIGAARTVSTLLGKPIKRLYGTPKESAYILFLSMLSGYPVGASMTAELYGAGAITEREAKAVAAFASTSGPIFMLGTVGSAIFHDIRVGIIVLSAHYLAALLNGLIFRIRPKRDAAGSSSKLRKNRIKRNTDANFDRERPVRTLSGDEYDDLMARTISTSTVNMLYVGGYIVLCGMLVDTLSLIRADALLERCFGYDVSRPIIAALYGLIEMTRGCVAAQDCPIRVAVMLCAGAVSFGGLSVTLQNYTFLSRCGMKFHEILLRKACQALIAAMLARIFSLLL